MTTVVFSAGKTKLVATSDAKFSNLASGRNKKDEIDRVLSQPILQPVCCARDKPEGAAHLGNAFQERGGGKKSVWQHRSCGTLRGVLCFSRSV